MEITLEQIQKKFEGLPENLKWAIMGANVDDNIIDIGKEQGLNVEQLGQLSLETYMEMFGFTPPEKFEESVQKSMQLPPEKTHALVEAINEKIFKKIREQLGETHEDVTKASSPETSATTDTEEEKQKNEQVLKEHGIEIIPEKLELAGVPVKPSILEQKISTPVQMPIVKTEHSLENITKVNVPMPNTGFTKPTIDPYREIPE